MILNESIEPINAEYYESGIPTNLAPKTKTPFFRSMKFALSVNILSDSEIKSLASLEEKI